jgi:hypothetical protein
LTISEYENISGLAFKMIDKSDKNGMDVSSIIKKIIVRFKRGNLELSVHYQIIKTSGTEKKVTNQFMFCSFHPGSPLNPVLKHFHLESPDLLKKLVSILTKKIGSPGTKKLSPQKSELFEYTISSFEKIINEGS